MELMTYDVTLITDSLDALVLGTDMTNEKQTQCLRINEIIHEPKLKWTKSSDVKFTEYQAAIVLEGLWEFNKNRPIEDITSRAKSTTAILEHLIHMFALNDDKVVGKVGEWNEINKKTDY